MAHHREYWRRWAGTMITLSVGWSGCADGEPREITEIRQVERAPLEVKAEASAAERFNLNSDAFQASGGNNITSQVNPFSWELPSGWRELPATPMRLVNLGVEGTPEIECYVSLLPGGGGDLLANVNRWRKQMGLNEIGSEELTGLPEIQALGQSARYIELRGNFTSMSGQKMADYFMVGAIGQLDDKSFFIKMTGPASAKDSVQPQFLAFIQSLKKKSL